MPGINFLGKRFRGSGSIRRRLFWILGGLGLGILLIINLIWLPSAIVEIEDSQSDLRRVAVQGLRDQIGLFLEEKDQSLRSEAQLFSLPFLEGDRKELIRLAYRLMKRELAVEEIGILDERGHEQFRLSRRITFAYQDLRDLSASPLFREGIRQDTYWGAVLVTETSEPWVTLAVPLRRSETAIVGLLYGVLNLKSLWSLIGDFKLSYLGRAYVVDQTGRLIAADDPSLVLRQLSFADRPIVRELTLSSSPTEHSFVQGAYTNENKVEVMASGLSLSAPRWAVVVEQPQRILYAPIKRKLWFFAGVFSIGLVVSFALAHLLSRRFTRPVLRLREGVEQVARGNLEHKVVVGTTDEIGELASKFNHMADQLRASQQNLERKVEEKTSDLSSLYAVLTPLAPADSEEQMLTRVIERVMVATGADAGLIRIMDKTTGAFVYPAQVGFPSSYLEATQRLREGSAIALAFRTGEPVIAADIADDPRLKGKRQVEAGLKSFAFLPLKVAGEVRGVIHLASREMGRFNEEKKNHLMAIARQMGVAMENRELFEETERRAKEQEALNVIAKATSQLLDRDELLGIALDKILEVTGRERISIRLKDTVTGEVTLAAHRGFSREEIEDLLSRVPHQASEQVFASGQPLVVNDRLELHDFQSLLPQSRSVAWIPIKAGAKVVGVLGVSATQPVPFVQHEVDLLQAIGNVIGVAIENARLFQETEQRARQQEALNTIAMATSKWLDLKELFGVALAKTVEVTGRERVNIRLKNPLTGNVSIVAYRGFTEEEIENLRRRTPHPMSEQVFASGEPLIVNDDARRDSLNLLQQTGSVAWIPIKTGAEVVGVLGISDKQLKPFLPDEVNLLQAVGSMVGVAIENARLFQETKRRNQELQSLYTVTSTITRSLHIETLMQAALETTIDVLGVDAGRLYVLDEKNQILRLTAYHGLPVGEVSGIERYAPGEGIIGTTFTENRPMVFADMASDPNYAALARGGMGRGWGFRSAAGLPVTIKERPVGVIYVYGRTVREFTPQDIELLSAIGSQIGFAIENARLFQETQQNLERVKALREIDQAITSTLELRTVLDVLLEKIDLVLPYSATTVRLLNKESGAIEPVACRNLDEKEWKAEQWRGGRGIPNVVFESKAALMVRNIQADPRIRDPDFFRKHGLISYLGLPLIVKDEALGVLSFYTKEEHDFTAEEVEFLSTLAGQAALAIYNSQLYEEMGNLAGNLARSNKVKSEFLSVMSHELRTPLNVVMGYIGMMSDGLLGAVNPRQKEALDKVLSQTKDQLAMVNNILQTTQLEAGTGKVERYEVELGEFLRNLKSDFDLPLSEKLKFIWNYPSDLPLMHTDSGKLKQILQNLINNAIKFTERGYVTTSVRYHLETESIEFKVADTGIGIPEDSIPTIFEMFRQVDSSETRPYGGVGVGLYIVKKFTDVLGGTIDVESMLGKGSTFTVTLPINPTCRIFPERAESNSHGVKT